MLSLCLLTCLDTTPRIPSSSKGFWAAFSSFWISERTIRSTERRSSSRARIALFKSSSSRSLISWAGSVSLCPAYIGGASRALAPLGCGLPLALHARLLEVRSTSRLGQDTVHLHPLIETPQEAVKGLSLSDYDLRQTLPLSATLRNCKKGLLDPVKNYKLDAKKVSRPGCARTEVLTITHLLCMLSPMNSRQLQRWLRRQGCTFHVHRAGSGHITVRLGDRTTQLPMHGGRKELGRKLVAKIMKDLGLD